MGSVLASLYLDPGEAQQVGTELDRLAPLHQELANRTGSYRKELKELEERIFWLLGFKVKPREHLGTILVVDDTPENLRLLSAALTQQGYTVSSAISGKLALSAVANKQPDLILLDIRMPGMDGYAVCEHLKGQAATQHIPILFLSASQETEDKVRAFAVGGADYVSKPFHIDEVLARVQHQLQIANFQQRLEAQNVTLREEMAKTRKVAQTLHLQEQLLRGIYEGVKLAIAVVDVLPNGKFHFVETNPAHEALTGLSCNRLKGRTLAEVLGKDQVQILQEQYRACVDGGQTLEYECTFPRPDGTLIPCRSTLVPLRNEAQRIFRIIATTVPTPAP